MPHSVLQLEQLALKASSRGAKDADDPQCRQIPSAANRCTVAEIQETLLHSLPYCGAPAAQEAFRAAQEVLDDMAKQP